MVPEWFIRKSEEGPETPYFWPDHFTHCLACVCSLCLVCSITTTSLVANIRFTARLREWRRQDADPFLLPGTTTRCIVEAFCVGQCFLWRTASILVTHKLFLSTCFSFCLSWSSNASLQCMNPLRNCFEKFIIYNEKCWNQTNRHDPLSLLDTTVT